MRIAYVARHNQPNSNDDEGAISHALAELGHEVLRYQEQRGHDVLREEPPDLLLFHKWCDPEALRRCRARVKAFWWFDLVDHPDPSLAKRCRERRAWMDRIVPLVDLGFCTDGDWVQRCRSGKLRLLRQGADGRTVGRGDPDSPVVEGRHNSILFTGGVDRCGVERQGFFDEMGRTYGDAFTWVSSGWHRRNLADLIACHSICVAPWGPATDCYWSNRAYLTLGFGGFLLHPFCLGLAGEYKEDEEVTFYRGRENMHHQIKRFLLDDARRREISEAGLERTKREYLYVHRCARLMEMVEEVGRKK